MLASAPRFLRNTSPKALATFAALSLFAAGGAIACEDMSVPLGNDWSGVVDGVDGMCSINKDTGNGLSVSLYSDIEQREGYWMLSAYDAAGPKGAIVEGDTRLEILINGKRAGYVTAAANGDIGGENYGGYQSFQIPAAQMAELVKGKTKGFKIEARLDGKSVFTMDARGAKRAFKDYGKCHAALPESWEALASAHDAAG